MPLLWSSQDGDTIATEFLRGALLLLSSFPAWKLTVVVIVDVAVAYRQTNLRECPGITYVPTRRGVVITYGGEVRKLTKLFR